LNTPLKDSINSFQATAEFVELSELSPISLFDWSIINLLYDGLKAIRRGIPKAVMPNIAQLLQSTPKHEKRKELHSSLL
jgi:hypothetical protein